MLTNIEPAVFNHKTLQPFTKGVPYLGHETGLYPGGSNEMPSPHRQLGEQIAGEIQPLDVDGNVDPKHGRIAAMVVGHSNCLLYFSAFSKFLRGQKSKLHPRFELLNAAVGGQQLHQILQFTESKVWDRADELVHRLDCSAKQTQVLFLHTTYHGAKNQTKTPAEAFPEEMRKMEREVETLLRHCMKLYPNLKLAYITCDGLRHFTGFEPHVWREAFAFKWLIEKQIKQEPGTLCEGKERELPWLQWGPYIWDHSWDESYFTDGVHPSPKALAIFVEKYWKYLQSDPVTQRWLLGK